MDHILSWLTKDSVTFWIAVAGFAMSLSSWIYNFLTQRRNISFHITECKSKDGITIFFLHIENKSRLPIAVTRISLLVNALCIECEPFPTWISEDKRESKGKVLSYQAHYSMQMPVSLSSLGAVSGYVLFQGGQCTLPNDATHVTFLVGANRGRSTQMTVALP